MLRVKTPDEVLALVEESFLPLEARHELIELCDAVGRVLAEDICASEFVPDFDRSTVDGYAVRAEDTFGCSDSLPAILRLSGKIKMGSGAETALAPGECCAIPTGGAVPDGADCCVMLEYAEDYGDGTVGIAKPGAPGMNMIFRGDDVFPGKKMLEKGRVLSPQDIGALAAAGVTCVPVVRKIKVGVISTGDELVSAGSTPANGQMRDVNEPMLCAMLSRFGAQRVGYGICPDDVQLLEKTVRRALDECDAVIISGGSSVGEKDASVRVTASVGEVLLHGVAMKPGKPTILGRAGNKPILGLPGHPVAAYFAASLFALPLIARLEGRRMHRRSVRAKLSESVSANHGRAQYTGVRLECRTDGLYAVPVRTKSGLITNLAGTDGYFCIDRDCEGLPAGAEVSVIFGE